MANEVRSTVAGSYIEIDGLSISATVVGAYLELNSSEIRSTAIGSYLEILPPNDKFEVYFKGLKFNPISVTVTNNISIADATILVSTAKEKIPILPSWSVDLEAIWSNTLLLNLGNLSNQIPRILTLLFTDKDGIVVNLSNSETFILNYSTDVNIDRVMTMKFTFVGSGVLS